MKSYAIFNLLRALNRVSNKRAVFEVTPPIEIPSIPRSELGTLITLTRYSSGLSSLPEDGQFKIVLRSISL